MAKIPLGPDPTGVKFRVKVQNSASAVGAGLTTLAYDTSGLQISVILDNSDTATVYSVTGSTIETIATIGTWAAPTATKCRFRAVDGTNHPGIYEVHLADGLLDGAGSAIVTLKGASGMVETDVELDCSTLQGTVTQVLGAAVPGDYTEGSLGYAVGTNLDAPVSGAATVAEILTTPGQTIATNASGQVVASSVEGAVTGAVASVTGSVGGNVGGSVLGSVASLGTTAKADVLAQVEAWFAAATAEPTGPPAATASMKAKMLWAFMRWITAVEATATEERVKNAAGAVVGKAAIADAGGTTSRGAFTQGP